jgi:prolipoprotein diacylglyceryltransferase
VDTYRTILYLHLVSLAIGFGAGAVLMVCLYHLKAAQTLEEAVPWATVAGKTEKAFPVAIVGLFLTGAYMTHDLWTWDTGWIGVSLAGLILVALQGPLVGGRAAKQVEQALHANGPGPLGEEARRMTRHPGMWVAEFGNLGIVFGIMWNMTQKPGTGESVLAIVLGYALGLALALNATRSPAKEAPPLAKTIG